MTRNFNDPDMCSIPHNISVRPLPSFGLAVNTSHYQKSGNVVSNLVASARTGPAEAL
jgi:hypothetical protein